MSDTPVAPFITKLSVEQLKDRARAQFGRGLSRPEINQLLRNNAQRGDPELLAGLALLHSSRSTDALEHVANSGWRGGAINHAREILAAKANGR